MNVRTLMKLGIIAVASATVFGCGGGGGGGGVPSGREIPGGKAVDGYLKGATVFADCNGNLKLDSGDVQAPGPTDDNGNFKPFSVPASCRNAKLIAMGGIDLTTGKPFNGILMAPPGSKNITPLTTLVAQNPSLEDKLKDLLGNQTIDVDYVNATSIKGDIIELASAVATALNAAAEIVPNKSDLGKVIEKIADKLSNVTDLSNDTGIADAIANATAEAIQDVANETDDLNVTNATGIKEGLKSAINSILNAIGENATVSYGDVEDTINATISNATSSVESHVTAVKYEPKSIEISGHNATIENGAFTLYLPLGSVEENKEVEIRFEPENLDSGNRTYSNTTLTINVVDRSSKRSATAVLYPVNVVFENGTLKSISVPEGAKLTVTGTDSSGKAVNKVVLENKQADSTFDGTIGLCDGTPNCFKYDLGVVENKIKNETSSEHPLHEITNKEGNFTLTISFDGIPVDTITGNVEIRENTPPEWNLGDLSNVTQKYANTTLQVCDVTAVDPDGDDIESCSVSVTGPDGNTIAQSNGDISGSSCSVGCFSVSFNATGNYTFTFEATDSNGLTGTSTKVIPVSEWPPVPEGYVTASKVIDAQNNKVTFKTSDNSTAVELFVADVNTNYYAFLPANETINCSGAVAPITLDNVTGLSGVSKLYIYAYDAINNEETCLNGIPVYIADGSALLKCIATGDPTTGSVNCTIVEEK